jgi:hypothetical protein
MTVAKYLAGMEGELQARIAEHDARRWVMLASRNKRTPSKPPSKKTSSK